MFDQLQDLWAALTRIRKSTKRVFPYQEPQEPPGRSAPWAAHALQPISPQPQDAPLLTLDLPPPGVAGAAVPSGAGSCQPKQNKTGVTNPEIPNGMRGPQGADTSPGHQVHDSPPERPAKGGGGCRPRGRGSASPAALPPPAHLRVRSPRRLGARPAGRQPLHGHHPPAARGHRSVVRALPPAGASDAASAGGQGSRPARGTAPPRLHGYGCRCFRFRLCATWSAWGRGVARFLRRGAAAPRPRR